MDIGAHTRHVHPSRTPVTRNFCPAVGVAVLQRRRPLFRPTVIATLALAALPDVLHLLTKARRLLDGHHFRLRIHATKAATTMTSRTMPEMLP